MKKCKVCGRISNGTFCEKCGGTLVEMNADTRTVTKSNAQSQQTLNALKQATGNTSGSGSYSYNSGGYSSSPASTGGNTLIDLAAPVAAISVGLAVLTAIAGVIWGIILMTQWEGLMGVIIIFSSLLSAALFVGFASLLKTAQANYYMNIEILKKLK